MEPPSHEELEALAVRCLDELPEEIRTRVANLGFLVEDEPPEGTNWLATYQGEPFGSERSFRAFSWPSKITIYRGPVLRLCEGDPERLEAEMRHLIRHEVAHYFGISDRRLIEIDRY